MSSEFYWIAVAVVAVVSAARITRLLTYDQFPPIAWARLKYQDATNGSDWQMLSYCPFCMSFWVTLAVVAWGYGTDFDTAWWLVNGVFAGSYVAAMIQIRDGDDD